ncbi:MAG: Septum site-determining protein MinD [Oscillospiraceae bacterium]|nr:Septum site-determining protein MinD [Oscillospiraceae bacterium]
MGTVVTITSGKGGTGKTTVTAALASRLSALGKQTLCIDMDCSMRNLDLALGLSDRAVMNFIDVIENRCTLDDAVVPHPKAQGLYFLSAPAFASGEHITESQMKQLTAEAARQYDYVLLDSPAGLGHVWNLSTCPADVIVVVANTDPYSLRDASRVAAELSAIKADLRLVVNRVQPKILRKLRLTIDDAIDQTGLPLLGLIPEDTSLILEIGKGRFPVFSLYSKADTACRNIVKRLIGQSVPLCRL